MNPERWQAIEELYHSASALPDGERNSFLHDACGPDQNLFLEVESLLRHGSTPQSILDTHAVVIVAKAIAADEFQSSTARLAGKTISHYQILEPIGRGGMGVVYKAEDLKLGRFVALKMLPAYLARDSQGLQRFQREAQAASALNHPNICTVYEIDESNGLHFISVELLQGESLKARMTRGSLQTKEILRIAIDVSRALEAAHSAGIVHRDVKPANIFLTQGGAAKVLDFGVAKRVGREQEDHSTSIALPLESGFDLCLTIPGTQLGTVAYMSPEQAGGLSVDPRSDIFSLGAVLYQMTTGQLPFTGKSSAVVIREIQSELPAPISDLNPRTPSGLSKIIGKALQKERSLRYQNVAELRLDLQALLRRLETAGDRRKLLLVPALMVVVLAIVASAYLRIPRVHEWVAGKPSRTGQQQIKSLAVLPLLNLTGESSQDYFVDGMTDALITNLAKFGSLQVVSNNSSMKYKETHKSIPEIARELGVNAVVEGSVARSGTHVRISAKLVDAENDRSLWTRDYDRDVQDIFQLQNELARAVAEEVAGKLTPQERTRFAHGRPVKPEVYDAYLKGRYFSSRPMDRHFSNRPMEEGLSKGIAYFQEAIRLDPNYAPAYSGLADNYSAMGFVGDETDGPQQLAIQAAKKAISLDGSLPEAHASLGSVLHRYMQDWNAAEEEYQRAIELDPNYATAHRYYGVFRRDIGEEDLACQEFRLAHELDPLNPGVINGWARCFYGNGQFEEAVRLMKDNLEMDPNNVDSLWTLGEMYERKSMFTEAIEQYQKAIDATGGNAFIPLSLLASAYAGNGETEKAETILREMKPKFGEDKWISASVHARMGRKEQAIRELTEDVADCGPGTCGPAASLYISNWRFDTLRSDPKFQALLKKFNYPDSAFRK